MGKSPLFISITKLSYIHASQHLTEKQVQALFKATETAFKSGCPLNRFITIHYDDLADKKRPQKFVLKFLEHSRKWLQRRGLPVAYLYTLENGKTKGLHVHILIHIPRGCQRKYRQAMARWLPFEIRKPRVDTKTIQYPDFGKLSPLHGVYGTLRYMCKGINPKSPLLNIEAIDQGEVMGRRWGISKLLR